MTTTQKTPGYTVRLQIRFAFDKHGRKVAYRLSGACIGMVRQIRMSLADAEQFLAEGLADAV